MVTQGEYLGLTAEQQAAYQQQVQEQINAQLDAAQPAIEQANATRAQIQNYAEQNGLDYNQAATELGYKVYVAESPNTLYTPEGAKSFSSPEAMQAYQDKYDIEHGLTNESRGIYKGVKVSKGNATDIQVGNAALSVMGIYNPSSKHRDSKTGEATTPVPGEITDVNEKDKEVTVADSGGGYVTVPFDKWNDINDKKGQAKVNALVKAGVFPEGSKFFADESNKSSNGSVIMPQTVEASDGTKVELTASQVLTLSRQGDTEAWFNKAKELGLYSKDEILAGVEDGKIQVIDGSKYVKLGDGQYMSKSDFESLDSKYQDIARNTKNDSIKAVNEALATDHKTALQKYQGELNAARLESQEQLTEFNKTLAGFNTYKSGDGYDIAKALRMEPGKESKAVDIFGKEAVDAAKQFNEDNYGTGLPDNGKNTPKISREQFAQNQLVDTIGTTELPDVRDPDRDKKLKEYQAALDKGFKTYEQKYGKGNVALSEVGLIGEMFVVPAMTAIRPEKTIKDVTTLEWVLTGVVVVTAAVPAVRGVAAGVRAGKTVGRAAADVAISEVKAPFTSMANPTSGLKAYGDIAETAVRTDKIPLEAVEIRTSTVRIPLKETNLPAGASKALRDEVVTSVIKSDGTKAVIEDTAVDLTPTALNRTSPAAVHATADVRPFLEGAKIEVKYRPGTNELMPTKEQGLFVSPSLHTRFTKSPAFGGEVAEGAQPGALIIRDEKILSKLADTNKIYRGTTEIESKLPVGVNLGKPNQILFTRNMSGDKLSLLVYGKPFNRAEIAKMKILGASDTVKQIFTPAYKVSKTASKEMDELASTSKTITKLEKDIKVAKSAKDAARLNKLERELNEARREAERLSKEVDTGYTPARLNPIAIYTGNKFLTRPRADILKDNPAVARAYTKTTQDTRNIATARGSQVNRVNTSVSRATTSIRSTTNNARTVTDSRATTKQDRVSTPERTTTPDNRMSTPERGEVQPDRVNKPPERVVPPSGRTEPPPTRGERTPPPPTPEPPKTRVLPKGSGKAKTDKTGAPVLKRGSLAWQQGALDVDKSQPGAEPVYKYGEPPDYKVKTTFRKPKGYQGGEGTPKQTIQTIGGPVKKEVNLSLGVTTAHAEANSRKITFTSNERGKVHLIRPSGKDVIKGNRLLPGSRRSTRPGLPGLNRMNRGFRSEKVGRIYRTRIGGGSVLSRRPIR